MSDGKTHIKASLILSGETMKPYYIELENGSILIEWISPDARFCINIEVDPSESGWCYVTKDGRQNCSGYLPPEFMRLLKQTTVK